MKKFRYYVYCLIDPTNDHKPFYVGKGTEDRVGQHLKREKLDLSLEERNSNDKKIAEIRSKQGEPYSRLFMWNLSEDNAFAVETALINILPNLTNISQGQNLENVRAKEKFNNWIEEDDVDLVHVSTEPLDFLDAEDPKRSTFLNKTIAYNAAGSNHKNTRRSYHKHKNPELGIKMWTGNFHDPIWVNTFEPATGDYFIGGEKLLERYGSWKKIRMEHEGTYTRNRICNNNDFLCFTKGLSPRGYVRFLGVYRDDWTRSKNEQRLVRTRVKTRWTNNK